MPVCASIAQRSVLIQPCDFRLITTENVDLLDCKDILQWRYWLGFLRIERMYLWLTIQESRNFSLSLQRCWMVAVEAFQIFVTTSLCNEVWLNVCFEKSSNTGLSNGEIRNLLLVYVIEFGCSKRVFVLGSIVLSAILLTNGDEKFGQKKVELIGRYVFNCSRLFQWLTKFLQCV